MLLHGRDDEAKVDRQSLGLIFFSKCTPYARRCFSVFVFVYSLSAFLFMYIVGALVALCKAPVPRYSRSSRPIYMVST